MKFDTFLGVFVKGGVINIVCYLRIKYLVLSLSFTILFMKVKCYNLIKDRLKITRTTNKDYKENFG